MKKIMILFPCAVLISLLCFKGIIFAQVEETWAARTSDTEPDTLQAVTTDSDGNVYVTGYRGSGSAADILTVKYNDLGVQQWAQPYDGSGSGADVGYGIVVDDGGNVYVVGETTSSTTKKDFIVIKYDSSGTEAWGSPAIYNGTANENDGGKDIAIDGSGNIVATGYSESATDSDYATLKISDAGAFLWTPDATLYNGTAGGEDLALKLALDSSDNPYVTGYSDGVGTGRDFATVKYNSSGAQQWVCRKDGAVVSGGNDIPKDIGLDGSNFVYVTGYSAASAVIGDDDYLTMKIDHSGNESWSERYNDSTGNFQDRAQAIAVHPSGLVHVTGHSYCGSSTGYDYATLKYGSNGVSPLWVSHYDGPGSGDDRAVDIVVDRFQNVFVTGYSEDETKADYDYATLQYHPNGSEAWIQRYNGTQDGDDIAWAMAIDESRNVYVTGLSNNGSPSDQDGATIKYTPPGSGGHLVQIYLLLLLQ